MKIIARQVPLEYQRSPLDLLGPDEWPENIAITGNRDYTAHEPAVFARTYQALYNGDILDNLEHIGPDDWYKNATAAIVDALEPEKPRYSTRDIHQIKQLAEDFSRASGAVENGILCRVLSIVIGEKWTWKTIHGSGQSDWQEVFYPADEWSRDDLDRLEAEYFNEGIEWDVWVREDGDDLDQAEPPTYVYTTAWDQDGQRREIAAEFGGDPADVVLYELTGWSREPKYQIA